MPGYFGKPKVAIAAQVRLPGGAERLGEGWTTSVGAADGWRGVGPAAGDWSAAQPVEDPPVFPWPATPGRSMRQTFTLKGSPSEGRLYIAALGGYDIWVNGQRVGDDTLRSEPADYAHRIPYRAYDVGPFLRAGENVVAVMVADGFYASYSAPAGRYAFGAAPRRVLLQVEAMAGGKSVVVGSSDSWRAATSPLRYSEIYGGEDWDAAFEQRGWTSPGFDAAGWDPVWVAPVPTAPLMARLAPPVRVTRELAPRSIRALGGDRHLVDFGQNFAGRVRLKLVHPTGQTVSVRHAEILTPGGEIDQRNLRAARAQDTYRLAADGAAVTLEPRFTYQGFRYVEVSGVATLAADAVRGLVLNSDLQQTGHLGVENPLIQKIWTNALWSQRSNFVGIPTDCPQRDERLGWTGDAQVFWATAAFNMDVTTFTREWLRDVRAAQGPTGGYPLFAPLARNAAFGPPQATPGWADAGVMLPYVAYLHSGDRTIVDENWTAMRRYVDGLLALNPTGLWKEQRGADFGDWLAVDAKWPGEETTPKTLVATAMLARSVSQLAQLALWTGRADDAQSLTAAHAKIKAAYIEAFVRPDGSVGNDSQCGYILTLALDLAPPSLRAAAAARLVADIRRRGVALSTGFLGTPLALDALADTGHADVAFDLLLRTEAPSWGHMIEKGATTMWERWNGDTGDVAMNSYNHYAFGAVGAFLYTRVAGVEPLEPGFGRVRIAPLLDPRTGQVSCRYDSVRGPVQVEIRHAGGAALVTVTIPPGVQAEVVLPVGSTGPRSVAAHGSTAGTTFQVDQGTHVFQVRNVGARPAQSAAA
jgi:alpha-L-rhamnosidase